MKLSAILLTSSLFVVSGFTVKAPQGFLRIQENQDIQPNNIVIPPVGALPSDDVLNNIDIKDTGIPQKGYGAFAKSLIEKGTYLGTFQGLRYDSRELLDEIMQERMEKIQEMDGDEGKYLFPMDYVISLDGGKTFIDGFERYVVKIHF